MAFIKFASDLFSILKKGSRTGYFSEPHSVVCSNICGTPVASGGKVLNAMLNTLFLSSLSICRCSAPVCSCIKSTAVSFNSGTGTALRTWNPCIIPPTGYLRNTARWLYVDANLWNRNIFTAEIYFCLGYFLLLLDQKKAIAFFTSKFLVYQL